jgi:NADPH:quinone reductase-like Zn-dependent oxidoreductase
MRLRRVLGWTLLAIPLALFLFVFVAYWMSDNVCGDPGLATPADPIRAIIHCDYGTADVLELRNVEKPVPGDDQILVKVRAAAVNPLDWHFLRGTPYVLRLDAGLRRPENIRLGVDFAGTVEAVGANVTRLEPGDDVFGGEFGAFGEYVAVHQDWAIVKKPAEVSFEQAASAPIAAVTALQALRDRGKVQPGERVLINGASGGVGTFAVQLAGHFGAHVTGVCSTRNLDLVRSLGADEVIDYTQQDFTESGEKYDLILDMVGNRTLSDMRRVMTPGGRAVLIGGGGPDAGNWIGPLWTPIKAMLYSPFVDEEFLPFLSQLDHDDLTLLGNLMQDGTVTPVIDRRYSLAEVPDAVRYVEEGHARGKVIIQVN